MVRSPAGLAAFLMAVPLAAATVTVNDVSDSTNTCATTGTGTCTLRDALSYANGHAGTTIAFDIAGSAVHTIAPASPLPGIAAATVIDGYTQPGASPNTNPPDQGTNAKLLIEIDGTNAGASFDAATLHVVGGGQGT